jgi:small-conductance mechanosensitive channel
LEALGVGSMTWLIVLLVIVLVITGLVLLARRPSDPMDAPTLRVMVGLHAVRRRLEVAQFRSETRREAARARRDLRAVLDETARRQRTYYDR